MINFNKVSGQPQRAGQGQRPIPPPQSRFQPGAAPNPQQFAPRSIPNGANRPMPGGPQSLAGGPHPMAGGPQPMAGGPQPMAYPPGAPPMAKNDPHIKHKLAADQLIRDCYSKFTINPQGKRINDITYQTHIAIKEFSSFPSHPPPANLPADQIGSVKDRVLVICVKSSGRVILQKGKHNEAKNLYQIGRTWDMDELKSIVKAGNDGFLLNLNKEYFWKSGEGVERIWKFVRALTNSYGQFMGRYPALNGWSLQDLKLPPLQPRQPSSNNNSAAIPSTSEIVLDEPKPDPQVLRSRSLKQKHMPKPLLPPEPQPKLPPNNTQASPRSLDQQQKPRKDSDYYKELDFTANGKLPNKPMKVMQVDRPGTGSQTHLNEDSPVTAPRSSRGSRASPLVSNKSTPYGESKDFVDNLVQNGEFQSPIDAGSDYGRRASGSHPYQQKSPFSHSATNDEASINDSHSFIFAADQAPGVHEATKQDSSPLRNYKPQFSNTGRRIETPESLEGAAALGAKLEEQLDGVDGQNEHVIESRDPQANTHSFHLAAPPAINVKSSALSPDFGIEEVTDSDASAHKIQYPPAGTEKGLGLKPKSSSPEIIGESTQIEDGSNYIDTSIQEIEDFMDSQLHFSKDGKRIPRNESRDERSQPSNFEHSEPEVDLNEEPTNEYNISAKSIAHDSPIPEGYALDEDEAIFSKQDYTEEPALNIGKAKSPEAQLEKDAELDELFDEVGWDIQDTSETLLRKFNKELNGVKHRNVKELVSIDLGMGSASNDLATSLTEIENLNHIFKKTEIDFNFLAPQINLIESNSKGLQVMSVNKKELYKDLRTILEKVSVNSNDLKSIEKFKAFDSLNYIPELEKLLAGLYGAIGTVGHNAENDDLSKMKALKQYQGSYKHVTAKFIRHFNAFMWEQFPAIIAQLSERGDRTSPDDVLAKLKILLSFSGITFFIKSVDNKEFEDFKSFVNGHLDSFLGRLLLSKLKSVRYSHESSLSSRLSQSMSSASMSSKKSRINRLSVKRDKFIGKFGSLGDEPHPTDSDLSPESAVKKTTKISNEIEDPKVVLDMISEAGDLMAGVQLFLGYFFHYDVSLVDFGDFVETNPFQEREQEYSRLTLDMVVDDKTYSNDLVSNMGAVFGNYINSFIKRVTPNELIVPILLLEIDAISRDGQRKNQEFLVHSFLRKISDKFKGIWEKLVKSQIDMLDKAIIKGKGGVLPTVKNLNRLVFLTESSIQAQGKVYGDIGDSEVRLMLNRSYGELTKAAINLFARDDPLLKNNEHDDKEREHRSVSIMQNIFYVTQQLSDLNTEASSKMKNHFDIEFKKAQDTYFRKLINKNIGKLTDFIKSYETASSQGPSKTKRNDKKYLKTLLSNYTSKDVALKANDIFRKIEKHVVNGEDMFEQDLVKKLWADMESQFINYFNRLNNIVKSVDKDIEYNITRQEIHHIFTSIHSTR